MVLIPPNHNLRAFRKLFYAVDVPNISPNAKSFLILGSSFSTILNDSKFLNYQFISHIF